jgi:predicted hotdog family 3-hydroxylacyl-ACP dehydratase
MSALDRAAILRLIPHAGAMCLLDGAQHWDEAEISCTSMRYAQQDNPLRRADATLGASCLIEIASQAMALHGRLAAATEATPGPGFLVSLRDATLHAAILDGVYDTLTITARRVLGDARGASYAFSVHAAGMLLAEGRAMVLFQAPA